MNLRDGGIDATLDPLVIEILTDRHQRQRFGCLHIKKAEEVVWTPEMVLCLKCAEKSSEVSRHADVCVMCGEGNLPDEAIKRVVNEAPYSPTPPFMKCTTLIFVTDFCDFCLLQYVTLESDN